MNRYDYLLLAYLFLLLFSPQYNTLIDACQVKTMQDERVLYGVIWCNVYLIQQYSAGEKKCKSLIDKAFLGV